MDFRCFFHRRWILFLFTLHLSIDRIEGNFSRLQFILSISFESIFINILRFLLLYVWLHSLFFTENWQFHIDKMKCTYLLSITFIKNALIRTIKRSNVDATNRIYQSKMFHVLIISLTFRNNPFLCVMGCCYRVFVLIINFEIASDYEIYAKNM